MRHPSRMRGIGAHDRLRSLLSQECSSFLSMTRPRGAFVLCVRDLFDPPADFHYGRVVKQTGGGALVGFRSVVDALRSTCEVRNAGLRA